MNEAFYIWKYFFLGDVRNQLPDELYGPNLWRMVGITAYKISARFSCQIFESRQVWRHGGAVKVTKKFF